MLKRNLFDGIVV